jgi:hypothetical protein
MFHWQDQLADRDGLLHANDLGRFTPFADT